jgi:predicted ATPase with chaperone activity
MSLKYDVATVLERETEIARKIGRLELAHEGTLFLDEVAM